MSGIGPALRSPLFADAEIAALFSAQATLRGYGEFEVALACAQAAEGLIPEAAADAIAAAVARFVPESEGLRAGLTRDGLAVPAYVSQLRARIASPHAASVHWGATSQDVIDTVAALSIRAANRLFAARLDAVLGSLDTLAARHGDGRIMGRTRMQAALEIPAAHRVAEWRAPVAAARHHLDALRMEVEAIQLGGPVGDRRGMEGKGDAVAARIAAELGLVDAPCWHTDRTRIVRCGGWLAASAGACGKIGQDVALMAQMGEIRLAGGGESSAMPHKRNPIRAEALVALARQAAALAGGLQHVMLHEQERSGSAWAMESLMLPPLCEATGASLREAETLLNSIEGIGQA